MSEATPLSTAKERDPGRPPMDVEKALNESSETSGRIETSVAAVRAQLQSFIAPVIAEILRLKTAGDQAGQMRALVEGRKNLDQLINGRDGIREQLLGEYRSVIHHSHELSWVVQRMIAPSQVDAGERLTRASYVKPKDFDTFYSPAPANGLRNYGRDDTVNQA